MDAQSIISQLESRGMSLKDIHELSSIGLSSLYAIKKGERSGETSLSALQSLLDASQSYVSLSPPPSLPGPIVESTIASIDNQPIPSQRALQAYNPGLTLQETQSMSQVYRQSRNRYSITPDDMMREIQGLRFQLNEVSQRLNQQQKQHIRQATKTEDSQSTANMALLFAEGAKLAYDLYRERKAKQEQEVPTHQQLPPPSYRETQQVQPPPYTMQYMQRDLRGTYSNPPSKQPTQRTKGIYGNSPSRQPVQEEKPSGWQKFKKFLGY